ncbi:reverse transcriptase domain-containing protein [Tanacetum coccineum]
MPGCSWRGHLRGAHIHYCPVFLEGTPARGTYSLLPGVLGGDTCEGYIFISARVFLEGTPVMGTYGFHYCPGVLGGDTYDGNCLEKYQVKYATCTLLDGVLTWWNSHKRTIGTEAAFSMSWRELIKLMTEVYCPRNEIQKTETELWNLTMKNNDLTAYTQRFQELTMMCTKMVPNEEDRVEKFIGGLPDNIQGNGYVVRNAENKRRLNNNYGNNCGQQPPHKRQNTGGQNVARAYIAGQCTAKCRNCKRIGHLARDCRSVVTVPTQGNPWPNQGVITCFECGTQGHYRKDCPKVKNQNCGNKARVPDARGLDIWPGIADLL